MTPSSTPNSTSNALIDAAFRSLPGIAFECYLNGPFLRWNQGYETLLGWTDNDLATMLPLDTIVVEDRERVAAYFSSLKPGDDYAIQLTALCRNGSTRPLNVTGAVVEVDGKVHVFGCGSDLSQLLSTTAALARSERSYREIFNATSEGLIVHDTTGRIIDVNDRTCELFGYSREEMIGKTPARFNEGAGVYTEEGATEYICRALAEGPQLFEWRSQRANGEAFCAEVSLRAAEVAGQTRVIASVRDISARKAAEGAALAQSRLLAMAVSATQDAVWQQNGSTGEFYFSPRWYEMLGYRDQEFPMDAAAWGRLLHPDDGERVRREARVALFGTSTHGYEVTCRVRRADGTWAWILSRGAVMERDAEGQPLVVCGTNANITERKRAEEEHAHLEERLRQAQKMESIGRLAGGVAHDFNNLLTAITGNLSLALLDSQLDPETRILLDEIGKASESAANLTRQLLAFSRKQVISPRILCINNAVHRIHKMLSRLVGDDIDLHLRLDPDVGQTRIDEGQLEQILVNLVANARDAMPDGGKLTIETSHVLLDEGYCSTHGRIEPGPYVLLSVSDSGKGMSADVKAHVFEPFYTTKDVGKGTGLGLAMVYGAVQQHHGAVEIYSEVGLGTSMHIYLPKLDAPEECALEEPQGHPGGGHETVFVVEDAETVRDLAKRILVRFGYRVQSFDSGEKALAAIADLDYAVDLLLTDVVMPNMNGRVLAERAQALRPQLKVIYTSGFSEEAIVHHGVLESGIDFLAKPYSAETLTRRVRTALDG